MISIVNALIVNEGRVFRGSLKIDGTVLAEVASEGDDFVAEGEVVDAQGCYVLPGVIDEHVHFREPGLTQKADIRNESRAAAAGGVTTFFDMPNTVPQTTTLAEFEQKRRLGTHNSLVNYAFYIGATNDNAEVLQQIDTTAIPAIKVFMGASTGNMLVEKENALNRIFDIAARRRLPIMAHCEDSALIARNEARVKSTVGQDAPVEYHAVVRNEEVCLNSTRKAIALARQSGAELLVAHVSTAAELKEIAAAGKNINAEACVAYTCFSSDNYASLGGRIKCNPAIKSEADRQYLRGALSRGEVLTVATDHAPHLLSDKQGGAFTATSGMPSVQFSLPLMLQLVEEGVVDVPRVAELMCHNPARYFGVVGRGFIRPGYKADLVLVRRTEKPHVIADADVVSKCGWTPYVGVSTNWRVETTLCNGTVVYRYDKGFVAPDYRGEAVEFKHEENS